MIIIRVGKLATVLGVHRNTVRNWIKTGKLPVRPIPGKKYVIESSVLDEFLQAMGVAADVTADNVFQAAGGAVASPRVEKKKENPQPPIYKRGAHVRQTCWICNGCRRGYYGYPGVIGFSRFRILRVPVGKKPRYWWWHGHAG